MAASSAPAPYVRAGFVAGCAMLVWWATVDPAPMPPVSPLGPQPVYSSLDPVTLVALEPVLHAPWLGTAPVVGVALVALLVVLGGSGIALFAGASTPAALLVLIALVMDSGFSAGLAHASGFTVASGLVWLAAGAAFGERSRVVAGRRWLHPLGAIVLWAIAVWWYWLAVLTWPIVLAANRRTPERPGRGLWTIGSLLIGAVAVVWHFAWIAHESRALTAGLAVPGWRDALDVAFDARPRMPIGSYAAPELSTRPGSVLLSLAALGLAFGSLGRWWRRTALLVAAGALAVAIVWSEWQAEVMRFTLWSVVPLSAVGLTWLAAQARRPLLATACLGAVAVIETIVLGARPLEGAEGRRFRDALASALSARADSDALAVVAEDTRIDSALVSWMAARAPRVIRLPQDRDAVAGARKDGRVVLAGPVARRHLEVFGVSFGDGITPSEAIPYPLAAVDDVLQCTTVRGDRWSQLPGLQYTGRLGLHLPPGIGGELQVIIGDALVLPVRAETPDRRDIALRQDTLSSGPGVAPPPADFWIDDGVPAIEPLWIHRVRIPADPLTPTLLSMELGRRAPRVIARLVGYGDDPRGRVCAVARGPVHLRGAGSDALDLRDETLFGAGWYGRERPADGAFRWAGPEAVVLVDSAARVSVDVSLEASAAAPLGPSGPTTLTLRVNGTEVGARLAADGTSRYSWRVPAGVWVAGTNELWWTTSRAVRPSDGGGVDTRSLALRVSAITLEPQ